MATCLTALWSALCKALRPSSRKAVEQSNLTGTHEESKSEWGRQAPPVPRVHMDHHGTGSLVLVVSCGAVALMGREQTEVRAIKKALASTATEVVECKSEALEMTLDQMCTQNRKVALHLVGHHCTRDEGSHRQQLQCETMVIFAHSQQTAELRVAKVSAGMSTQELVDIVNKRHLEFVFCNASNTAHLADKLECYAFGWKSACVEQAAALLAALFYRQLSRGLHYNDAFEAASMQIASPTEQRACFELIDPSNPQDIKQTMPDKLIWHSSMSTDMKPSEECLEGTSASKNDAKSDGATGYANYGDANRSCVSSDTVPGDPNHGDAKRSRISSDSALGDPNHGDAKRPRISSADLSPNTLACFVANLTDVCPSPSDSLCEFLTCLIDGDGTYELGAESSFPAGVPFSNSGHFGPSTPGACAPPDPSASASQASQNTPRDVHRNPQAKPKTYHLTDLVGIGVKKADKLKRQGIHTVEALANVDVENIELAKACTGNRRYDEAQQTLKRWRDVARKHLSTRNPPN